MDTNPTGGPPDVTGTTAHQGQVLTDQPPHDLHAEQAALGSMLASNNPDLVGSILEQAQPVDYYDPRHQTIAAAVRRMHRDGLPTDPIAVATHLSGEGSLARLGGVPYLHEVVHSTPNVLSGPYYAGIVAGHALTRGRQTAALRIVHLLGQEVHSDEDKLRQQLGELTQLVLAQPGETEQNTTELHWPTLLATDYTQVDWLVNPLLTPGAQISLIGDGKVGKSLFAMEIALQLANGQPCLNTPDTKPTLVGYVDQENSHQELRRRLWTLGYDHPDLLSNLVYQSFPRFGPLDTPAGAGGLIRWVTERGLQVVILDTISRMIVGPENDADTWLALYRLTMVPLKAAGVSVIRLDHFGKDKERGSRGSSAKTQDVDHEWTMTALGGGGLIRLHRTYTRNGIGDGTLLLHRRGHPEEHGTTAHTIVHPAENTPLWDGDPAEPPQPPGQQSIQDLVDLLDELRIPPALGREKTAKTLQAQRGFSARASHLQEAINYRRHREAAGQQLLGEPDPEPTDGRWADDTR